MAINSVTSWTPRQAGLGAILGAIIGVALTPFMASVWTFDDDEPWSDAPRLERAVGPTLESWGLLDFGGEDVPYEVYGKPFFLVYALMIPAVGAVHATSVSRGRRSRLELWSWRMMFGALLAGGAGDFVAYWGVSLPGVVGDGVSIVGFSFEFFAMPVLLLSSIVYGIATARASALPLWICGLLIMSLPAALATTALVTDYLPNAVVVPVSLIWAAIGGWLWVTGGEAASDARSGSAETLMSAS